MFINEEARDDLPKHFINDYAATKRLAEIDVLSRTILNPIVLRPRGIYGAGDTGLLPRLMRVASRSAVPLFSPAEATDITHVDDAVTAVLAALDAPASGVAVNISGGIGLERPQIIAAT